MGSGAANAFTLSYLNRCCIETGMRMKPTCTFPSIACARGNQNR